MPVVMIRELAELVAERMNMFPAKQGTSEHCSPNAIMSKQPLDCRKHCQHSFGACAQAHAQNDPANTPAERAIDAMCLRPDDNKQGGHKVMNLDTGKATTRNKVTPMPLTRVSCERELSKWQKTKA